MAREQETLERHTVVEGKQEVVVVRSDGEPPFDDGREKIEVLLRKEHGVRPVRWFKLEDESNAKSFASGYAAGLRENHDG